MHLDETSTDTRNLSADDRQRLVGLRISYGLGMGTARVVGDILRCGGRARPIGAGDVDRELERLKVAFDKTRAELQESARRVEEQFNAQLADIFRAHEMMLEGLFSSDDFARELRVSLLSAEAVVRRVFRRWREAFQGVKNETLQQRADDMVDIGRKVLRHLEGEDAQELKNLAAGTVLVVQRLLPSDVVALSRRHVVAIVVESLGFGSHAALL